MNLAELQVELADRGCVLWVEGQMLRFRAPDGALTPPLMAGLKRHKKALIRLLNEEKTNKKASRTQEPSFGQQAMWLLHESAPESPAYNVASAVKIESEIDYEALRRVWQTLLSRHDSLRTTFETCGGQLVARVHDEPLLDIQHVPACGESDATLRDRVKSAYSTPFDLTKGPLARLRVFTTAPQRHVLLLSMHHIVLDAWSLWVLHDELGALYQQEVRGGVGVLPAGAAKYADFVRWQQEMPNTQQGRDQWNYWKDQLAGDPEPARLPWDRPRPQRFEQRGASLHFRLPAELANGLRELGRSRGATPFMTLLAVFQALVHRHSSQTDFLVGATTSGRSKKQFNRLVGYLVNTLPLRAKIQPGDRFSDLLERTRGDSLDAMAAQDFPFPLMVERLNPRREAGALPLCRVMFGLQKPHDFSEAMLALDDQEKSIDWGGLQASAFSLDQQEGQFDLTLEMYETTSTFLGILKYDTNLLDRDSAELLARRYEFLAQMVVEHPEVLLDDLDLVAPDERERLVGFGPAAVPGQAEGRIEELFAKQAAASPEAVAIVCDDAQLTYSEADCRSNQIARWLQERGVERGAMVACSMTRGIDAWLAQLGCFKAGAAYVPLDESGPTDRLCDMLRDCRAGLLLTDSEVANRLELSVAELPTRMELLDEAAEEILQLSSAPLKLGAEGNEPAYVIYTSGSTGDPKGVVVTHAAFGEHLRRIQPTYEITSQDRVLQFSSMTFDPSLEQAWSAWSAGATLVVRGPRLWSASEFWSRVGRHAITVANLPPAYFRECTDAMNGVGQGQNTLRLMIVGGDAFPMASLEQWQGSNARVLNAYGPTEAVVTATTFDITGYDAKRGWAPIGKPLAGTEAYVVDKKDRLQPIGVPGELLLSGPALATQYLKDEALTAERFATLPGLTGGEQPVYRTGDLVRWNPRGELEFLGRLDRQVKINGYRVELGEVERALEAVVGVGQAVARVQETAGGEPALVAYYSAKPGRHIDPANLAAAVRTRLPHYMTPVALQSVDAFPVKASGKVDLDQLDEVAIETKSSSREYTAPENDVQRILAEVWSDVLGIERVGIHDDFFELGGASLKSLQIVSAAESKGVRLAEEALSPALLFEYPTIAELAELLVYEKAPVATAAAE